MTIWRGGTSTLASACYSASSWHCVSPEFPTRFYSKALQQWSISFQWSGLVKGLAKRLVKYWSGEWGSGCVKMVNNLNNLVKGSSMRKLLQNSKGYVESPEFLPALGLFIFKKKSVATTWGIPSSLDYNFFVHTYIHVHQPGYITQLTCACR